MTGPLRFRPSTLLWGLLLGCLAFAGAAAFGDPGEVLGALARFPLPWLGAVLVLSLANYGLRLARWDLYLRSSGVRLRAAQSATVFLAGLAFSVSPGKAGELVKSYMLRQRQGIPVPVTVPVVLMERASDLLGVLLLTIVGGASLGYGWQPAAVGVAVVAGGAWFLVWPGVPAVLGRVVPRWAEAVRAFQGRLRVLATPRLTTLGLALSAAAWFAECLGFWLVVRGLGGDVGILAASFVYALGTLVGALSLLPGGLVTTEGSLLAALALLGVGSAAASAATVLIRLCTLWFAVAVGMAALWAWGRAGRAERSHEPASLERQP